MEEKKPRGLTPEARLIEAAPDLLEYARDLEFRCRKASALLDQADDNEILVAAGMILRGEA